MGSENEPELLVDNKSAIDVAYNPEHHGRMKHVERRHFFVRELVEDGKLRVTFVRTHDNLSDLFTKALEPHIFFNLRDFVMNVPSHLREPRGPRVSATGGRSEESASGPVAIVGNSSQ